MIEFVKTLGILLDNFPPVILSLLAVPAGALIFGLIQKQRGIIKTPKELVETIFIGTVTGGFCGALIAPMIGSVTNLPGYCSSFVSGASGHWIATTLLPKKQDDYLHKP
ncbi:hypothetical protein CLV58_109182 [Spirosoma oryzae]|uniref:Uncharacterized protein n=1 Tax=Spirosoma oryzae TaxID=1469603 RepID=A0A2T0SYH0_9BACT|nr:hypothetical protein [Spirosoma oryzae]PRY38455.1 hypothetical protein CLV58_109182 [Spirosoma oryzae]